MDAFDEDVLEKGLPFHNQKTILQIGLRARDRRGLRVERDSLGYSKEMNNFPSAKDKDFIWSARKGHEIDVNLGWIDLSNLKDVVCMDLKMIHTNLFEMNQNPIPMSFIQIDFIYALKVSCKRYQFSFTLQLMHFNWCLI